MVRTRMLTFSAVAACLLASAAAHAAGFDGTLSVSMPGALPYEAGRGKSVKTVRHDLTLELHCRDGKWGPTAWAFTPYLPGQEHLGKVIAAEGDAAKATLQVELAVNHNRTRPTALGGTVRYTISLAREGDAWKGTYTGSAKGVEGEDVLRAIEQGWGYGFMPGERDWSQPLLRNRMDAKLAAGDVAGQATAAAGRNALFAFDPAKIAPGEHPRLLFRKADLDALRKRAATPEGQKFIAAMKAYLETAEQYGFAFHNAAEAGMGNMYATGYGLLYQLTGDKAYARKAIGFASHNLYGNYWYGGWWVHPYTLMGLALTYDLCYDAWGEIDPEFRDIIYSYLELHARQMAMRHDPGMFLNSAERFAFANDQSDFAIRALRHAEDHKYRAAAAIGALAILNDPPAAYKPTDPAQARTIEPAAGFTPWIGVSVVPFESDIMPRQWLVNGPFKRGDAEACLKPLGGLAGMRPEPGDTVLSDGVNVDFRRYLPDGHSSPNGPKIYVRTCGVYWGSGTGGGYGPGIELQRKWRETEGKRTAHDVVIYTVINNDRERTVQALPNWRSPSIGNRMWINGTPVKDGDIVRLKKGLYPLAVEVRLIGGYSGQEPKLRAYGKAEYDTDMALHDAAVARTGGGVHRNDVLRNYLALTRSVQRYVQADIGADGWGVIDTQEALLPLVQMTRHAAGVDLARGTALERLTPLAARMRGHADARVYDYMVSQSTGFMRQEDRAVARWYLDTYGLGIRRPFDAVLALTTHPLDVSPTPPSEAGYMRSGIFAGYHVHTFRSGWQGGRDVLVTLDAGNAAFTAPYVPGNITIHGLGFPFVKPRDGERYLDANVLSVTGAFPVQHAKVLHTAHETDGSGALSFIQEAFREGKVNDRGQIELSSTDAKITLRRAIAIDYSGTSGATAVIVTADTISGAGHREKVWRYDLGEVGHLGKTDERLELGKKHFTVRPVDRNGRMPELVAGATMRTTFVTHMPVDFTRRSYHEGKLWHLEAKLDRAVGRLEKVTTRGPTELKGTADHEDLLEEIEGKNKAQERRNMPPLTVFTVTTLQTGDPPAVRVAGDEKAPVTADTVLHIGSMKARFDGTKIIFE